MALTKEIKVDQITVTEFGIVLVRETTIIKEDNVELSQKYQRFSFPPGSDISSMPTNVQAIAQAAWTPEVIAAYKELEKSNERQGA